MIKKLNDMAVSPIVGVMLLLIITIIIAAVASGFAGGLLDNTGKAPTLSMDVHIRNNGYWTGSEFSAKVTGVESAIPTKDLKIITSWTHKDYLDETQISGGATIEPNQPNVHVVWSPSQGTSKMNEYYYVAPYGYGIGVGDEEGDSGSGSGQGNDLKEHFGNYSLAIGTVMWAEPFGASTRPTAGAYSGISHTVGYGVNYTRWAYSYGETSSCNSGTGLCVHFNEDTSDETGVNGRDLGLNGPNYDAMMAVLGKDWENLREGDIVTVSVVHTPSGKTIWEKEVTVEG